MEKIDDSKKGPSTIMDVIPKSTDTEKGAIAKIKTGIKASLQVDKLLPLLRKFDKEERDYFLSLQWIKDIKSLSVEAFRKKIRRIFSEQTKRDLLIKLIEKMDILPESRIDEVFSVINQPLSEDEQDELDNKR